MRVLCDVCERLLGDSEKRYLYVRIHIVHGGIAKVKGRAYGVNPLEFLAQELERRHEAKIIEYVRAEIRRYSPDLGNGFVQLLSKTAEPPEDLLVDRLNLVFEDLDS